MGIRSSRTLCPINYYQDHARPDNNGSFELVMPDNFKTKIGIDGLVHIETSQDFVMWCQMRNLNGSTRFKTNIPCHWSGNKISGQTIAKGVNFIIEMEIRKSETKIFFDGKYAANKWSEIVEQGAFHYELNRQWKASSIDF